ncbi:hypothetical protein C8Q75DRAFT_823966 [Abortiporus biennis]|nr:hypothetical protein C8Q75DRAFT_823966 [Abortiporus biennis]
MHTIPPKSKQQQLGKRKLNYEEEEADEESEESELDENSDDEEGEDSEEDEVDLDAPRVAQWVDDEELELSEGEMDSQSSEDEASDFMEGPSDISKLKMVRYACTFNLSSLPLGTLRKAQSALSKAKAFSDSEEEEEEDEDEAPEVFPNKSDLKGKGKEKAKQEIQHRKNKHAPMEVTSKKPVPRKKVEITEKQAVPRDPRFLPLAGEFSAQKFQSQYGFLADMHQSELKTLRDNLKRARKLLLTSPRDLREAREEEVDRLERAVKRAESMVNKDRREKIEQTALAKVAQEEREKRKQGKGAWYMKESDKKELLTRAKFDALAASGGRGAVKKAIEKKQKKISQKEKKKRPFPASSQGSSGQRSWGAGHDAERPRANKRQRFG